MILCPSCGTVPDNAPPFRAACACGYFSRQPISEAFCFGPYEHQLIFSYVGPSSMESLPNQVLVRWSADRAKPVSPEDVPRAVSAVTDSIAVLKVLVS